MLKETISEDLKKAMIAKNTVATASLRMLKSRIMEIETAKGAKALDDDGIIKVIRKMVKDRTEMVTVYANAGREDASEHEAQEIEVLKAYLPADIVIDEDFVRSLIKKAIEANPEKIALYKAGTAKGVVGLLMGSVMKEVGGLYDPSEAMKLIEQELTNA